jgi:hypothetical protein
MFADITSLSVQSEDHRAALLADAENYRLARLVRRTRRRRETPRSDPPRRDRSEPNGTPRNDEAERRYAMSR